MGFIKSRGSADVKYQCHGLVPQAEAPLQSFWGKTLDRKAVSSGQRSILDCQKYVSTATVNIKPAIPPLKAAGMKTTRMRFARA